MNEMNDSAILYEVFLDSMGSSLLTDSSYLFIITPLAVISSISNLISFLVFFNQQFKNVLLFDYLKGNYLNVISS